LAGLSLKTLFVTIVCILLFVSYLGVLIRGENSLIVLSQLKSKRDVLSYQSRTLREENQALQKVFFELKQLCPDS
jgi:hypothetical protein